MVYEFCSTSKISFAGGGVAALAASKANLEFIKKQFTVQTIGYDKVNQLRHVRYFKDMDGVKKQMMKQAAIMRPKFEMVEKVLSEELGGLEIGSWINPKGGYFICFESLEGCAKSIVAKAKEAGVTLTGAGAPSTRAVPIRKRSERLCDPYRAVFPDHGRLKDGSGDLCGMCQTCERGKITGNKIKKREGAARHPLFGTLWERDFVSKSRFVS